MPTDLAGKFWDLSNAIVAFSVLQMIAFLYALARQDFRDAVAICTSPFGALSPQVAFSTAAALSPVALPKFDRYLQPSETLTVSDG